MVGAGATHSGQAALPAPKTVFVAYDHSSQATGFHLEFAVGGNARLIPKAFIISFKCRVKPTVRNVPVSDAGGVDIDRAFAPRRSRPRVRNGNFVLSAQFLSPTKLRGTYRVTKPGCDTGVRSFTAVAGEGHAGHELPPNIAGATPAQRAQVQALLAASKRAASRFPTIDAAFKAGFVPHRKFDARRLRERVFHLESCANWLDDHVLDPRRPETLVYWYPPDRRPVLIAFMYRVSRYQAPPKTGGPVIRWHTHGRGPTQMTHVWFADILEDAFAHHPPHSVFKRVREQSPSLGVLESRSSQRSAVVSGAGGVLSKANGGFYYRGGRCLPRR